jgi:hypothetical protein
VINVKGAQRGLRGRRSTRINRSLHSGETPRLTRRSPTWRAPTTRSGSTGSGPSGVTRSSASRRRPTCAMTGWRRISPTSGSF